MCREPVSQDRQPRQVGPEAPAQAADPPAPWRARQTLFIVRRPPPRSACVWLACLASHLRVLRVRPCPQARLPPDWEARRRPSVLCILSLPHWLLPRPLPHLLAAAASPLSLFLFPPSSPAFAFTFGSPSTRGRLLRVCYSFLSFARIFGIASLPVSHLSAVLLRPGTHQCLARPAERPRQFEYPIGCADFLRPPGTTAQALTFLPSILFVKFLSSSEYDAGHLYPAPAVQSLRRQRAGFLRKGSFPTATRQNVFRRCALYRPQGRRRLRALPQRQDQMRLRNWPRSLQELRKGHARVLSTLGEHGPSPRPEPASFWRSPSRARRTPGPRPRWL